MGCCFSSSSSANYMQEPIIKTSKIVCMDGSLIEFSIPIRASGILSNDSSSFLCSADGLNYDEYIQALKDNEYVVPGKMYFVLPVEMLKKPVAGEDMAALAVKATSALSDAVMVKSQRRRGNNRVMPFLEDDHGMVSDKVNNVGSSSLRLRNGMKMKQRGREVGKVQLSSIPEEAE